MLQHLFSAVQHQVNATGSRSDVLRSLVWPVGILATTLIGLVWVSAPSALLIACSVLFIVSLAIYLGAFIFCLIWDRDALRSEKYSIDKMAIERGVYGDSRTGLLTDEARSGPRVVNALPQNENENG